MKRINYILLTVISLWTMSCKDDDKLPVIVPEKQGTMTIGDDEYGWVRYNGLDWMTSNFKGGTPYYDESISIDDWDQALEDFDTYGNLLTYEDAVALCPEGWRLPTDEDWMKLEEALGMSRKTAASMGWRGSCEGELIQQGADGSGIHLLLAGQCSMAAGLYNYVYLRHVREAGYYWTSTLDTTYTITRAVYYRRIQADISQIERNVVAIEEANHTGGMRERFMSVRYVRDAQ